MTFPSHIKALQLTYLKPFKRPNHVFPKNDCDTSNYLGFIYIVNIVLILLRNSAFPL